MKRFLSSVLSLAFVASLYAAGVAQSPAPMASGSMKSSGSTTKCPAGETYVKGYTNSAGTKVNGYCRSGATSAKKAQCPSGETWVNGYTKADGTVVKGYCRSSSTSSGGSMSTATHAPSMMGSPAPVHT